MVWTIEEAQHKLTALIDAANDEPQIIYQQEKPVAVIVEAQLFQEFLAWHQQRQKPTLNKAFAELRQLCSQENYDLEIPSRQHRD
jgi:PHD/YefM family antitoxin component YafN of YafNO toxin-antitoxin module